MAQPPHPRPPEREREARRPDARRQRPLGEDPGTLTDEEYLSAGGPDALDAAAPSPSSTAAESHSDSPPRARPRRDDIGHGEDPERPRSGSDP
jgi:hypothetical protein